MDDNTKDVLLAIHVAVSPIIAGGAAVLFAIAQRKLRAIAGDLATVKSQTNGLTAALRALDREAGSLEGEARGRLTEKANQAERARSALEGAALAALAIAPAIAAATPDPPIAP